MKDGANARFALGRYKAIVVLCYFFTNGQPDTRTAVFVFAMQPLKQFKYFLRMFLLKPYPVIAYGKFQVILAGLHTFYMKLSCR